MRRSEKAQRIIRQLESLYPNPAIPLDHRDPFTLLCAVILSAQSTDKKVNEITPSLFARASSPAEMAALPVSEIQSLIRQIGLAPQKAKSLQAMSALLMAHHDGQVPHTMEALTALPGVGRKTANVVRSQAFGDPAFPVDTHIHRLARRWGLSRGKTPDKVEKDLTAVFPEALWNKLHLQIIMFGRERCPALRHDFTKCPICSWAASKAAIAREQKKA